MSISAHNISAPFDMAAQGLACVLSRAREDRIALQREADAAQAQRNESAVQRALRVMKILGRQVIAFRAEVDALEGDNARLRRELAAMRSRALEAEGRIARAQKEGRLRAA